MQVINSNNRLSFIDTTKFFAISLVVWGHCGAHFTPYVYAFQVQIFFVVVGFVYKKQVTDFNSFRNLLVKLFYRIFIPYFVFLLIYKGFSLSNIAETIWGSNQTTEDMLWYFPAYISSVLLYNAIDCIILRLLKDKNIFRIIFCLIAFVISNITKVDSHLSITILNYVIHLTGAPQNIDNHLWIGFPFSVNIAFMGYILISFGRLMRHFYDSYFSSISKYKAFLFGCLILPVGLLFARINLHSHLPEWIYNMTAMSYSAYGNVLLFVLASCILSVVTILFSISFGNKYTEKWGKITLGIYIIHTFYNISPICNIVGYINTPPYSR